MAVQDRTRLIDAAHDRIRARFPGAVLACQKSIFDKRTDGETSPRRGSFAFGETAQSADEACKRENCPEKKENRGQFLLPASAALVVCGHLRSGKIPCL